MLHTFKISGNTNPLTHCHIPEDLNVHLVFIKHSVHLRYWERTCDNTSTVAGWTFEASPVFCVQDEVFPVAAASFCASGMLESYQRANSICRFTHWRWRQQVSPEHNLSVRHDVMSSHKTVIFIQWYECTLHYNRCQPNTKHSIFIFKSLAMNKKCSLSWIPKENVEVPAHAGYYFSQHSFWGFMSSWMWQYVPGCEIPDVLK